MICLFSIFLGFILDIGLLSLSCTASPVLPNKPFFVVWNHPSQGCGTNYLPFGDFGIVDNTNDRFLGDKIVLFYNLGAWPVLNGDLSVAANGGIPQRANMTLHLETVRRQVQQLIPDKNFSGLAVIDMELWRPTYATSYGALNKYRTASQRYAKEMSPKLPGNQLVGKARQEWNDACRKIMEGTLKLVIKLRPNAKWGYYGYPQPWNSHDSTLWINDRLNYIWNTSTGLYPSIYFDTQVSPAGRRAFIKHRISEAFRVKNKFSKMDPPILPYTLSQNGPYYYYDESQLADSIGLPAEMGVPGVVIWGASADLHRPNACQILKNHIKNTLGPYVLKLTKFFDNCSQQLCHGNGRCVKKEFVNLHKRHPEKSSNVTVGDAPAGHEFDDYACSCYAGSTGNRCDQK